MLLKFSWVKLGRSVIAACESDLRNNHGTSQLAAILMDTGGVSRNTELLATADAVEIVDRVARGETSQETWARETMIAEISPKSVSISSFDVPDEVQVVSLGAFRAALVGWIEFLRSPEQLGVDRCLEIKES